MAHGWKPQQTSVDFSHWGNGSACTRHLFKVSRGRDSCSTAAGNAFPAPVRIFPTHGIPEVLKTNKGRPFQGQAFHEFATEKGFHQREITPLWLEGYKSSSYSTTKGLKPHL